MKQINNGYANYYYLTEDGQVYNKDKGVFLTQSKQHLFTLLAADGTKRRVSLKKLYRLVYDKEYCKDNIADLKGEEWKYIEFTDRKYMISSCGRVKSFFCYEAMLLKPYHTKEGYQRIDIVEECQRKSKLVHRLVAAAFLPLPENIDMQLHHKDFNKENNAADNLQWLLPAAHKRIHLQRKEDNDRSNSI